jgi:CRISPR-associated protein Csb2
MLALRLDYLTGRAVATSYNDRASAEWPPHPARVFSALVASWSEHDPDDGQAAREEFAALEWLELQPPPALSCSDAWPRTVMTHFVPVNDPSLLPASLLQERSRLDTALQACLAAELLAADTMSSPAARRQAQRARAESDRAASRYRQACERAFAESAATDSGRETARSLLPDTRVRQARTFPSLALADPVVHLCWPEAQPGAHLAALERLAARLGRVGHSSSLVHARWVDSAPAPNWIPYPEGELLLRVPAPGQAQRLEAAFARHRGTEPRVLPFRAQRYRRADEPGAAPAVAASRQLDPGDWVVLRCVGGSALPLTRCTDLAQAVRGALMRHAQGPVPESLSGHGPDGEPSRSAHLMVLPLPHVGHRHADGAIKGLALLLPRGADVLARRQVLQALGRWEEHARAENGEDDEDAPTLHVGLGNEVRIDVQRQVWGNPGLAALRASTWCEPASEWLSVTPVALDRNPGNLFSQDPAARDRAFAAAAETIAAACIRMGLPRPEQVTILPSGTWPGGAKAARFPPFPAQAGKVRRVKVHARLQFGTRVAGPLVLGAGRFQGLGLFRPVLQEGA